MEEIPMEHDQIDTPHEVPIHYAEADDLKPDILSMPIESIDVLPPHYPPMFTSKSLLELSNSSWSRSIGAGDTVQPYLRGCKWSPDGTCCLSVVNNDGMHVTELPKELYTGEVKADRLIDVLDSIIHVKEAGLIYDFCWYPGMSSAAPTTCWWLTTRQNGPIQMWDAYDGTLRCTYRGFNWLDEMENALSLTFTADLNSIIAGYKKDLKTFDIERPGRDFTEHKIAGPASCLAVNTGYGNLLAVGSWNTTISLYDIKGSGTYKSLGKMHGHGGGVTHMLFTSNGQNLVSGARKDHRLLVWDIRHYRRPLNILNRPNTTNQRIYFDISRCGRYLVSGGTDGVVKVWDTEHVDWTKTLDSENMEGDNVTYRFPLHRDCCNGISINPMLPILATGSGQLHLDDPTSESDCLQENDMTFANKNDLHEPENRNSNDESLKLIPKDQCREESRDVKHSPKDMLDMKYSSYAENSLGFWWIGEVPDMEC